jgi:hypothetical protein
MHIYIHVYQEIYHTGFNWDSDAYGRKAGWVTGSIISVAYIYIYIYIYAYMNIYILIFIYIYIRAHYTYIFIHRDGKLGE